MSNEATVGELFELAIAAEQMAERLYRGLELKFAHCQEAADFWGRYAKEEDGHARSLERLQNTLSQEQLFALADPLMLETMRKTAQLPTENILANVKNLDDAYQLATEAEASETNAVFEFLVTHFSTDEHARAFLRTQLRDHVDVVARFPMRFKSVIERQEIKAK